MRPLSSWQMTRSALSARPITSVSHPNDQKHICISLPFYLKRIPYSCRDEPKEWEMEVGVSRSSYTDFCGIYISCTRCLTLQCLLQGTATYNPRRSALFVGPVTSLSHPMLPKCIIFQPIANTSCTCVFYFQFKTTVLIVVVFYLRPPTPFRADGLQGFVPF